MTKRERCHTSVQTTRLQFENFEQVKKYLELLLNVGYKQKGNWNLAQPALHLNDWITFPMDGYPAPNLFVRVLHGCHNRNYTPRCLALCHPKTGCNYHWLTLPATLASWHPRTNWDSGQVYVCSIQTNYDSDGLVFINWKSWVGDYFSSSFCGCDGK